MVDFWSNHFNVFSAKGADRWLTTAYDRDTIRPMRFGKVQRSLLATAQKPGDALLSRQLAERRARTRPARARRAEQSRAAA